MREDRERVSTAIGWAVYGSIGVGILGVIAAVAAFPMGGGTAMGTGLIASALAFGLLANALLR